MSEEILECGYCDGTGESCNNSYATVWETCSHCDGTGEAEQ